MKQIIKVYYGQYSILTKKTLGGIIMSNKNNVTVNELLLKVKETEKLNDIMMGCLRILDNLSRTEETHEAAEKLQDEINILLEDMK